MLLFRTARTAPADVSLTGTRTFTGPEVTSLPRGLAVRRLQLSDCPNLASLPDDLRARNLEIDCVPKLTTLPPGLRCHEIQARESNLTWLPDDLRVEYRLDLRGSRSLVCLPAGLKVGTLVLAGCTALTELPAGLDVCFLDLQGCRGLGRWPRGVTIQHGHLNLAGTGFTQLPPGVRQLAQLDLRDCAGFTRLPEGLEVTSWLDVGGSSVTSLPDSLTGVRLRWRGVAVPPRVAFQPETLTVGEILEEPNAEVRRVMLERVGFEWFFERANAEVLDRDRDAGGDRRLLRVVLTGDEPLVCLSVSCPSTGRQYALRVPPSTTSCRQAAAWTAGFDNPDDYLPLVET